MARKSSSKHAATDGNGERIRHTAAAEATALATTAGAMMLGVLAGRAEAEQARASAAAKGHDSHDTHGRDHAPDAATEHSTPLSPSEGAAPSPAEHAPDSSHQPADGQGATLVPAGESDQHGVAQGAPAHEPAGTDGAADPTHAAHHAAAPLGSAGIVLPEGAPLMHQHDPVIDDQALHATSVAPFPVNLPTDLIEQSAAGSVIHTAVGTVTDTLHDLTATTLGVVGTLTETVQDLTTTLTGALQPVGNLVENTLDLGGDLTSAVTDQVSTTLGSVLGSLDGSDAARSEPSTHFGDQGTASSGAMDASPPLQTAAADAAGHESSSSLQSDAGNATDHGAASLQPAPMGAADTSAGHDGGLLQASALPAEHDSGSLQSITLNSAEHESGSIYSVALPSAEHDPASLQPATLQATAEPAPITVDSHPLVPEPAALSHVDLAPLHLGFLGQSYAEGSDPHDGAFSAVGVHGFV